MASTLMRMKSRSLLPAEDQVLEDEELDPRFELVRAEAEAQRCEAEHAPRMRRGREPLPWGRRTHHDLPAR